MSSVVNKLLKAVAKEYGVSVDAIFSKSRQRDTAEARQMAMYLIHEILGYGSVCIGEMFGRERTTVIHAIQKIRDFVSVDRWTQQHYANLRGALGLDISPK